jgi:UDP-N-acetylmuramate--alanine ligase
LKRRYMSYGLSKQADLRAEVTKQEGFTTGFKVTYKGTELGEVVLATPGIHNVVNALAAIGVAIELDIPFSTVQEALSRFAGIHRRLEVKWQKEWTLMDDYGHHPTEIRATLAAIRDIWKGRVIVAFQPHRYTRTKALLEQFVTSFNEADLLVVTEIYAASEEKIEGISGSALAERISKSGHKNVLFAPTKEDIVDTVREVVAPGDLVITLGAGDIYKVGERLIEVWSGKESGARS